MVFFGLFPTFFFGSLPGRSSLVTALWSWLFGHGSLVMALWSWLFGHGSSLVHSPSFLLWSWLFFGVVPLFFSFRRSAALLLVVRFDSTLVVPFPGSIRSLLFL
jgi:hypothetical protein